MTIATERHRLESCRPGLQSYNGRLGTQTQAHKVHFRISHNMPLVKAPHGPTQTQRNRMSNMFHGGLRHDIFLEFDVRKFFLILVVP